ncbi:unnamed protein product [Urochloa decumbens]|uniref:NAC domain-containing protein n=1 Tax=Urochloa decumbens TaxID=240449 RepID=A0ABC9BU20_9POAL
MNPPIPHLASHIFFAESSMASRLGLPPGFRFVPTDDEVVAHYLLRRIRRQPLPAGDILEDDPLSAPPWVLLARHGRKGGAFFFAAGQAMSGKGATRQKRSCAGGGTWEGQGKRKTKNAAAGEGARVCVGGEEIEWRKYALNFQEEGVKGSTGWVMHEYSIASPPCLAASPMRLYRIRFSGHGRNAQKRKRSDLDWGSDEEEEEEVAVAEPSDAPLFVSGCPAAATADQEDELPALVDGGDDGWDFMCSLNDLLPDYDFFPGGAAADAAGGVSIPMVSAA